MLTISLRGFRAHLTRYMMSLVAIALGVSFVVASFCLRALMDGQVSSMLETNAAADVYVTGASVDSATASALMGAMSGSSSGSASSGSASSGNASSGSESSSSGSSSSDGGQVQLPLEASLTDLIDQAPGVRESFPSITGMVALVGADGSAVQLSGSYTMGVTADGSNPNYELTEGSWAQGDGQITLESQTMEQSGLKVGDRTKIVTSVGGVRDVTVVGVWKARTSQAGVLFVGLSKSAATAAFSPTGRVQQIEVYGHGGADGAGLDAAAQERLAGDVRWYLEDHGQKGLVEVSTGEQMRERMRAAVDSVIGFVQTFILVFALLALVTGAFIIMNTFAMIVRDRMREFAVLRSIGASPAQVFATVVAEAAGLGVIGSAVGVALGALWMRLLVAAFAALGKPLEGYAGLTPLAVAVGALTGVLVSLGSAMLPSRTAALTPPIEAMNETVRPERPLMRRAIAGAVILAVGVASLILAARYGQDPDSVPAAFYGLSTKWAFGVGAGATLVGAIVLAPAVLPVLVAVAGLPFQLAIRPVGQLACQNLTRNRRRTASTAGALVIGMAIVALFSTAAASIKTSTAVLVDSHVTADFAVTSSLGFMPDGAVDDIASVDGVRKASAINVHQVLVDGGDTTLAEADADMFSTIFTVNAYEGKDPADAIGHGEAIVGRTYASDHGVRVGDRIELSRTAAAGVPIKPVTVTVGTVLKDSLSTIDSMVVVDRDTFASQVPKGTEMTMICYVSADPGVDKAALKARIVEKLKGYYILSVMTKDELIGYSAKMIDQVTTMLYALLALSVLIALLGIANTLALSVSERTKEIGLLRAVGLGRAQLRAMFAIEAMLTSLLGTLIGMAVGVGVGVTLPSIFAKQGLTTLAVPWDQILLFLGVSLVVGLVASVGPSRKALKVGVLDAIDAQ